MTAAWVPLVGLCHDRLARRRGPRLAWFLAVVIAVAAAAEAADMVGATTESAARFVTRMVRWTLWGAVAPVAWDAAAAPADRDRREGVEALAFLSTGTSGALPLARALAVAVAASARGLLPAAVVAVAVVVASGAGAVRAAVGGVVAALVATWLVTGVAVACGALAGERGRSLLAAVVVLPWAAGGTFGVHASLPAGLNRLVMALTGAT